ncbi:MAG: FkbM family methyltransferase [Caulobacteraceae bacterium]|nr:FkbM family methyltransferase [Caulobacteraceae bacterium]
MPDTAEPRAAGATSARPGPPAAVEPPPAPRPAWRRALRFLKPPAVTLRGFLQAPMHGRLNEVTGEVARRTDQLADRLETLQRSNEAQAELLRRMSDDLARARERIEGLEDTLRHRLPPIEQAIGAVPAMFGPRFDELEMKARPPVPYGPGRIAVRLADGYVVAPDRDPAVVAQLVNATTGGFEPGTRRCLVRLLEPGMGVADVGAHIGLLTVAAARAVGPAGKVFAFEPEDEPRGCLERTLHLNGLAWVALSPAAAGRASGPQTFHVSPILGHSSLYALPSDEGEARAVTVEVVRLDDAVPRRQRLDVVKIDVEGAELDVLAGMPRLLKANPDIAVIAEYGPSHLKRVGIAPKAWMDAFRAHGFRAHAISEIDGSARRVALKDLARVESVNLAFVRPGGAAERRLLA